MAGAHENQTQTRYFVAKCGSMDSLRHCVKSKDWASRERLYPPQPHEVLRDAFNKGPVVLVFSVNNCHGWHGYCHMRSLPQPSFVSPATHANAEPLFNQQETMSVSQVCENASSENEASIQSPRAEVMQGQGGQCNISSENNDSVDCMDSLTQNTDARNSTSCHGDAESINNVQPQGSWHYFTVQWDTEFSSSFGETCLPSSKTAELYVLDKTTPLNKARNWQEMSAETGAKVCDLIDEMLAALVDKRQKAEEAAVAAKPPPFIQMEGQSMQEGAGKYWKQIVEKVEKELGRVHLACPFGSQRYNLQQPDSDIDAFIIYQAKTRDLLGFDPPKMTVKNSDRETCDYTVLEVKRYCELLLSYDARCIETLFLHQSTIIQASDQWKQLQSFRAEFLTRKCLDKYLGDALGSNGVQKFQRFIENATPTLSDDDAPPPRLAKLAYIVNRLLQNAVNIVKGEPLQVFRPEGSEEREVLLKLRKAQMSIGSIKAVMERLQGEINQRKDSLTSEFPTTKDKLESWMLTLRFQDFQHPPLYL